MPQNKIYILFDDKRLVAPFTTLRAAAQHAEGVGSLNELIPEAYRPKWTKDKTHESNILHKLSNSELHIIEYEVDPILSMDFEPDVIEGESFVIDSGTLLEFKNE